MEQDKLEKSRVTVQFEFHAGWGICDASLARLSYPCLLRVFGVFRG
jgi:hypothetical protein